jgi:endonuclease-3
MARESRKRRRARVTAICRALQRAYPEAKCELNYSNPLQLLVATILSAQCSDVQVNRVTDSLFRKYPDAQAYAMASVPALESELRRIGLYRNKAKSLKRCCEALLREHGGEVPDAMEALTRLAGVGRKTANVVLGNAFGRAEGVVVDTHVARLSGRLGLSLERTPERIEKDLMHLVPQEEWTVLSHWLIWHGRRRCQARRPDCAGCELREWCPSAEKGVAR